MNRVRFLAILILIGFFGRGVFARADTSLPPPPSTYVWDEAHVLKPETVNVLNRLMIAQDRADQVQFVISIFRSLGDEELVTWTNRIFQHWKIGQRGKDNGILLALYWNEHKVRIEVGYGLEPLLTDALSKRVISEYLIPNLKAGNPDQALVDSSLAILQIIQSPLMKNGEAENILKMGGYSRPIHRRSYDSSPFTLWLFLGLILLVAFLNRLLGRRSGMIFPLPMGRRRSWDDWEDRGGGGGFGGDGFSGGGGSSGGGGASGDW